MQPMTVTRFRACGLAILVAVCSTQALAATSTALYRIESVMRIAKVEKSECVDVDEKSCPDKQTGYWRVVYQATSPYAPVQQHELMVPSSPPQIGTVVQLTLEVEPTDK